ncbi:MAG: hypothetical protein H6R18_2853 [Proteobacteria bacterium]|nr:hypothetical protein [Pseudomonadota bacterium]
MKVEKIIKWPKNMAHLPYVNIAYDINKKYGGLSMPEIIQKISLDNSIWFIRPNSLPVINKKSNYSDYPFFKLTIYPGLDYFEPEPIERLPEVRKELNKNRSIFNIILGD